MFARHPAAAPVRIHARDSRKNLPPHFLEHALHVGKQLRERLRLHRLDASFVEFAFLGQTIVELITL